MAAGPKRPVHGLQRLFRALDVLKDIHAKNDVIPVLSEIRGEIRSLKVQPLQAQSFAARLGLLDSSVI